VDERLERLLRQQLDSGFADLHGAEAAITLPVSERLLNELVAETLPASAPVRDLQIAPEAGDRFSVRLRIGSSPLIPRLKIALSIDRQPELPTSPVVVLKVESAGLMSLAGPVLRLLNALPAGIVVHEDRIHIDLRALADRRGLAPLLDYLTELRVNTLQGALVLTLRGRLR
jgi:hypothetical protein